MSALVMQRAAAWESRKLRRLMRFRGPQPQETDEAYARAYQRALREALAAARVERLAHRIARAQVDQAQRLATAVQGSPIAATLWGMHRRRACTWRPVAEGLRGRDRANFLFWQHRRAGRPAPEWEATLVQAVGPDWRAQAGSLTPVGRLRWQAALLTGWSQAAAAHAVERAILAPAMDRGPPAQGPQRPLCPKRADRVFPAGTFWTVEARMDASAAVDAVLGCAKAPALGSAAAQDWARVVRSCSTARA